MLIAPIHYCGHCVKCVAGVQNQCREFTVLGNAVDGGNCELIAARAADVIPIPDSLDFNQAASVPLVFLTAWHMLVGLAAVRPGQTVLVLGASSGVGIAAIQIAKMFHCRVITTAGDEEPSSIGHVLLALTMASITTSRRFPKRSARSRTKKASTSSSSTSVPPPGTKV